MKYFLLGLLFLFFNGTVFADPTANCATKIIIEARLKESYREFPRFEALTSDGLLLRIYVAKATSSWTIVYIYPDGSACLGSAGELWREIELFDRING